MRRSVGGRVDVRRDKRKAVSGSCSVRAKLFSQGYRDERVGQSFGASMMCVVRYRAGKGGPFSAKGPTRSSGIHTHSGPFPRSVRSHDERRAKYDEAGGPLTHLSRISAFPNARNILGWLACENPQGMILPQEKLSAGPSRSSRPKLVPPPRLRMRMRMRHRRAEA
jgi:hypothetical protein